MATEELFTAPKKAKKPPLGEDELTRRLRARYSESSGNGNAWAFVPQVRNAAAFQASRTIDALAMSLWPSRGLTIYAHEIKSQRSDWLRELKKPEKAETFAVLVDRFYIVVGAADIVRPGELPETWGLMVPHGKTLRVEVEAPLLHPDRTRSELPPAFSRSFLAALLRAATYVGQCSPAEIKDAHDEGLEFGKGMAAGELEATKRELGALQKVVGDFERAAGVRLGAPWFGAPGPKDVGRAVRAYLDGDSNVAFLAKRVEQIRGQAEALVRACDERAAELTEPEKET